ncbi:alanine racemase [Desulfoluna butyratoxydans]|uniref:Alanine racemase n=1 Tax=Desulfoluna butyratoxydans TaxID=231438 RepID=A0A4U8YL14_9BACT|nr:alanine racemase [Desulfoluna butyratoxydans]VFQ44290.1 alanine racemase [Desulfoluna butyratoxydans]
MTATLNVPEPIFAEIDLSRIAANAQILKAHAGKARLMAVVKANAYGHGAEEVARTALAHGASWLGVARVSEAVVLREAGIEAPILILGVTPESGVPLLIRYGLRQAVVDDGYARMLSRVAGELGGEVLGHIKVDTGMGRVGFDAVQDPGRESAEACAEAIARAVALPGIRAEGIFTHFATADEANLVEARNQLARFTSVLGCLEALGVTFELRHAANTAGIFTLPEARFDMVRGGISLYGLNPSAKVRVDALGVRPAMQVKGSVVQVKRVKKGAFISYGGTWQAEKETVVATVPCGYGDGYPRLMSNRGHMLVRGHRVPVLGRVCMDMTMVDVTDVHGVAVGDEVVIMGSQGDALVSADEIAEVVGTINYEVTCMVASRVPRVYRP